MYTRQLFNFIVLSVALSATPALAQQARDFSAKSARVTRNANGEAITGPSNGARPAIVTAFLASRHSQRTVQGIVLQKENPTPTGVTHLTFGQQRRGAGCATAPYVKAALNQRGEIISVIENLAEAPPALVPAVETHQRRTRVRPRRVLPGCKRQPARK